MLVFTTATNSTYTNFWYDSAHSCKAFNNVFLDCGSLTSTNQGWYSFTTALTNVAADYNFVSKCGYKPVIVDSLQRAVGDPRGWDYQYWWEPHGINGGDPLFVNVIKLDFRLNGGSPVVRAALPLNQFFTNDMRGITRNGQWDIGALEFQAGETASRPSPPTNLSVSPP